MPLPWKKTGISRISRLMADLQPSKSCNSMVVQTGFPTSLVDLFVMNCDRLTKPSKKKKKHQRHHRINHHQPRPAKEVVSFTDSGAAEFPAEDLVNLNNKNNNNQFKTMENLDCVCKLSDRFEINDESDEGFNGDSFDTGCCKNRDGRDVLNAVFMVFGVVILALISIKILTIGITMSACVLIFLEYIGKHIFCFFHPCSSARIALQLPFRLCEVYKREVIAETKEEYEEDRNELNSPGEEIQAAEGRFDVVRDNEGTKMNLLSGRWGYSDMEVEEEEDECEVVITRRRKSSREFIKKLVPKKWRAMKKKVSKGKEETGEYAGNEEGKSGNNEEIEDLLNSDTKRRLTELQLKEEEHKISDEFRTESETKLNKKEEPVVKTEKNRAPFLLLAVALAGLVGGRTLALLLTVISCVITQLVIRRGQKQCVKMKKKKKTTLSSQ